MLPSDGVTPRGFMPPISAKLLSLGAVVPVVLVGVLAKW